MDYQLIANSDSVIRSNDGATIPNEPDNSDWQIYKEWLKDGNAPDPAVSAPIPIPQEVTRFQAKAALLNAGLLDAVTAAMAKADAITQLAWVEAVSFKRQSPMVLTMAKALSITDSTLDGLFTAAAQIS